MSVRKFLFYFLIFSLWFAIPALAAENLPADIEADSLKIIGSEKLLVAEGRVRLTLKNLVIRSDSVRIDTANNRAFFAGRVLVKNRKNSFYCQKVVYDINSGRLDFDGFFSDFADAGLKGKIFVRAKTLQASENQTLIGQAGIISSCDLTNRHYELVVKEFEYYPEDKIVARQLVLWVLGQKVLTRPYQVISLKKDKKQTIFPQTGHNQVEGWFVKNYFDYYLDARNTGVANLDFFQRKGLGVGWTHTLDLGASQTGWSLYHIDERDSAVADWVGHTWWQQQLGDDYKVRFDHSYYDIYLLPSGRREDMSTAFWLTGRDQQSKLNWKMENNEYRLGTPYQNFSSIFNYSRELTSQLNSQVLVDFHKSQRGTDPADLELEIKNLSLTYDFGPAQLDVAFKKRFDLDGDNFHGDENFSYFEKLPAARLSLKPRDLGLFDLSGFFGYSRYVEYSRSRYVPGFQFTRASSTSGGFDLSKKIKIFPNSELSLAGGFSQYLYGTGDARWGVTQKVVLENKITETLRQTITHTHDFYQGGNPFSLIDRVSDRNLIRSALVLRSPDKDWYYDISGGYNFLSRYYDDVLTRLEVAINGWWQTSLAAGYNLNLNYYKDVIWKNRWRLWADSLALDGGLRYDLNSGQINSAEFLLDFTLGQKWEDRLRFVVDYVFQKPTQTFDLRGFKIIKDLHCFDLTFAYQAVQQQFLLTLSIKAFPDESPDIGAGREGLFLKGNNS